MTIDIREIAMRLSEIRGPSNRPYREHDWPAIQLAVDAALYEREAQAYERCAATLEIFPIDDKNTMANGFRKWAAEARAKVTK